jgi:hypothetical protein
MDAKVMGARVLNVVIFAVGAHFMARDAAMT